jgi:asparagine synthase (glutamine-hydrolysing)
MCGIYGRWNLEAGPIDVDGLERATRLLRHRGPDDEGYLLAATGSGGYRHCRGAETDPRVRAPEIGEAADAGFDLGFGFRRLSILDLSPAGHQPMGSRCGRFWIVYNGEVYNYRELRRELQAKGHEFRSDSDTEVILASYQEWGEECLHRFNGMWAFGIWDMRDRSLFLARDRFGVKPLFYTQSGGSFAFASEIKALVGGGGVPFQPRRDILLDFAVTGALPNVQSGDTFFEGVNAVPPGHRMRVTREGRVLTRYYTLPSGAGPERGDVGDAVQEYRELFTDAVRLRLRSDVAVGSCLSGGVDSSSIVGVVNSMLRGSGDAAAVGERQKAFSAVYETEGVYNERTHIEKVIRFTGAEPNYVVPTAERLVSEVEQIIWHQEEPFGSTSIFAQWCVMAKARERGVTVLLDGQGADEALGGYRPFAVYLGTLMRSFKFGRAWSDAVAIQRTSRPGMLRLLAGSVAYALPEQTLRGYRRLRRRNVSAAAPGYTPGAAGQKAYLQGTRGFGQYLAYNVTESSLPHLLRYEDRNSMAFSVESRVPFVDYRLVEFSLTRATGLHIRDGWTKWILRQAMQGFAPEEILWRRDKVGFETPEADWLRALLAARPDLFSDDALSRDLFDLPRVREDLAQWARDGGDSRRIWRLINVELWLRTWAGR